ncbi:iron-containing alcohol dehydrogenase [Serinicoccus marinus]|uniref:iron-containing alcohol dehydrogenase n=1 Tax=Serinicoccus marinus TaxID=247333 RepID=UPI002492617B|nr:iron-containing alcohol dehydrogenase [Serinicoccus marinus]
MTEDERKTTGTDLRVLLRVVAYDATLTLGLPPDLAVHSGLNALAHAVDSLWAPRADPINRAMAGEGMRALVPGLRGLRAEAADVRAHEQVLYGTYLSGVALASAGAGMHDKICHVLGGTFNLPHAPTHAVVLPYVEAYNAEADPDSNARIAQALGSPDAVSGLWDLAREVVPPGPSMGLASPRPTWTSRPSWPLRRPGLQPCASGLGEGRRAPAVRCRRRLKTVRWGPAVPAASWAAWAPGQPIERPLAPPLIDHDARMCRICQG